MFSSTLLLLDVGAQEFIIIAFVILLLFGGDKLPELARGLGKGIRDFKDASDGVKREIHKQIDSYDVKIDTEEKAVTTKEQQPEVTEYNHDEYRYEDGNFDDVHKHTGVANTIPAGQSHVTATDQLDEEQPVDYYAMKSGENHEEDTNVSTDTTQEPNKS
jgi:sec-independent protein translocase protein TatA